jgi:hypothetical protein
LDLNQKYFEYQKAMIDASAAPDTVVRELHLEKAIEIASQIECFQSKLGAAASCAWTTSNTVMPGMIAPGPTGQDL